VQVFNRLCYIASGNQAFFLLKINCLLIFLYHCYLLIFLYKLGFTTSSMVSVGRMTLGMRRTFHVRENLSLPEDRQGSAQKTVDRLLPHDVDWACYAIFVLR
jgi:hypothetical protein